jgi:hypothetical protein
MQDVTVDGVEPLIGEIENVDIAEGRFFTDAENNNSQRVAFIGADVARNFSRSVRRSARIYDSRNSLSRHRRANGERHGFRSAAGRFRQLPIKTYGSNFGGLTRSRGFILK